MARRRGRAIPGAGAPRDAGFALIELLVVVIIIGILAAIAIPVFVHQREHAGDATIKSDLRTAGGAVIAVQNAGDVMTAAALREVGMAVTPGSQIAAHHDGEGYCLVGQRVGGAPASQAWVFRTAGGPADRSVTTCDGAFVFQVP